MQPSNVAAKKTKVMKKILIAMSHALTDSQIEDLTALGFIAVNSEEFIHSECSKLDPKLSSLDLRIIAGELVLEANKKGCKYIAMVGEPALMFYTWTVALKHGIGVLQSTTERVSVEKVQEDGSIIKTNVFNHVQWRKI